jgi:hypothetical protein
VRGAGRHETGQTAKTHGLRFANLKPRRSYDGETEKDQEHLGDGMMGLARPVRSARCSCESNGKLVQLSCMDAEKAGGRIKSR